MIDFEQFSLSYESTGFFSKIVADYISQSKSLSNFYAHAPNITGIKDAIAARQKFNTPRALLVEVLQTQYDGLNISDKVQSNINALLETNTFTVTTAHQPNIFTGPLYFIYKILHAVKLANGLQLEMPQYKFVPVYYMGSEDADLEELGQINLGQQQLVWETNQTGAVGRMKVDKPFLKLINSIEGQIGVMPDGLVLAQLFKTIYTEGKTIQQATLELVNHLFSAYGVVVLIPDNALLKTAYHSVVKKELIGGFSHHLVVNTIAELKESYKVQAAGREINLFYFLNNKRERIERQGEQYLVQSLGLSFSIAEILAELDNYPDRFSANVILRGGFQETVLPNIAFIGGGGELAYWIELKKVFEAVAIPYPVLIIRNSFLVLNQVQFQKLKQLGFTVEQLFDNSFNLFNELVRRQTTNTLDLANEINTLTQVYANLESKAGAIDVSLKEHVLSLQTKASKKLVALEKKMLRAEKAKFEAAQRQITALKNTLFPNGSLQERVCNLGDFYAIYGSQWIDAIYKVSPTLDMKFKVLVIKESND